MRKQYSTGLAKKKDILQFFLQNIENPEFSNLSVFLHKTFRGILGEKVKNKKTILTEYDIICMLYMFETGFKKHFIIYGGAPLASIRDVASRAGVSPATVSRVINGTTPVAADKRERVLQAIEETGFVPNEVARSLFKKSSKTIGVIIPSIRNPYFTQLADVIDEAAKLQGYRIVLYNVHHDLEQERSALQMLAAANADGVIVASNNEALQEELSHYNMPVVVVDALFQTQQVNAYLYCDYYQGGRLAAEHLTACGCRRMVCIRGAQNLYTAQARYEGYRDFCREQNLEERVVECDYDFQAGLAMTEELLERFPDVDGIIACNDIVAISVYKILHKRGIAVPEQIQLIGFDDIHLSSLISPELTTIHQPITTMGRRAVEVILQEGTLPKEGRQQVFPVSLVPRETTRRKEKNTK